MTDMIEKMARAIHAASYHPDDLNNSIVAEHWEAEKGKALKRAKAALSALEDPSEAMVEAGTARMGQAFLHGAPHAIVAQHTFTAMIKAAKGEE